MYNQTKNWVLESTKYSLIFKFKFLKFMFKKYVLIYTY